MTWSQLSVGAGIPLTTRNAAFRKFARIIPENRANSRSNIEQDRYHRTYGRRKYLTKYTLEALIFQQKQKKMKKSAKKY